MDFREAINYFLNSNVHIYLKNGAFVKDGLALKFNKQEHDKLFSQGYYIPDYKEWLIENSVLVPAIDADS